MRPLRFRIRRFVSILLMGLPPATQAGQPVMKFETFDADPKWEGRRNWIDTGQRSIVRQNFGFARSNHAASKPGELGGRVQRSAVPASFATPIGPKSLDDPLSASGTFAITATESGSGLFFGFFDSNQPGGSGRPLSSLGLDFDFEESGGRLAVRLITSGNKTTGTFVTPFLPGKYRPTPIRNDGTKYRWSSKYDPAGAGGLGSFRFTITSEGNPVGTVDPGLAPEIQDEIRARFPHVTQFEIPLSPELRREGARFDRFGLIATMKAGNAATIWFGDLVVDGMPQSFETDPGWISVNSHADFEEPDPVGANRFGFSPSTRHSGGNPGEAGGTMWRGGDFGFASYADRIGPLDLNVPLKASGRIIMTTAAPDSDVYLGWFDGSLADRSPADSGGFLGVHIGGPTAIGHYFAPEAATPRGTRAKVDSAPVLLAKRSWAWSIEFDPQASGGNGRIVVKLGDESKSLDLPPGFRKDHIRLDRFGLFTSREGGGMLKLWIDDVRYSAGAGD